MAQIDSQGIALILGAVGLLITTVGTFIVSMVTLARQGRIEVKQATLVTQQEVIHTLVNSQSEKLNKAIEAGALARGKIQGALEERANPSALAGQAASAPAPTQVEIVSVDHQALPLPVEVVKTGPKKT